MDIFINVFALNGLRDFNGHHTALILRHVVPESKETVVQAEDVFPVTSYDRVETVLRIEIHIILPEVGGRYLHLLVLLL